MDIALLVFSIIATVLYVLFCNSLSKNYAKTPADHEFYNFICCGVATLVLVIIALVSGKVQVHWFTVLWGVVYGIATAVSSVFKIKALGCGPVSYVNMIIIGGAITIPVIYGLFNNETVEITKFIGMALMLLSVFLAVFSHSKEGNSSIKWLVLSLVAMAGGGIVGIVQKIHQGSVDYGGELYVFMLVAFAISTLYSLTFMLIWRKRGVKTTLNISPNSKILWMGISGGTFMALVNVINTYLAGVMPSVVFFPVVNGATLLLVLLASVLLLKEKLNWVKWTGIVVGFGAIALLCIG